MVDLKETKHDPKEQFWEQVAEVRAGMLGLMGSDEHFQPMSPQEEPEANKLWFFLHDDSDLFRNIKAGKTRGMFTVTGKSHDYHACASGTLRENKDPAKVEAYWSPFVAAWFEGGKEDPRMTLVEMVLDEAAIWGSTDSNVKFAWNIAKANIDKEKTPDVGYRTTVRF